MSPCFQSEGNNNPKQHLQNIFYVESYLGIPNKNLKDNWKFYQQFSTAPPSQKLYLEYKKSKALFKNFDSLKNDDEKWLKLLLTLNDDIFVIQNIEYKLGFEPFNEKIWKFYFDFLTEKKYIQWLLDIYLRYCRYFIDNLEMREKYRNEIKRIEEMGGEDVKKWKLDCIKFERDFYSKESAINLMVEYFDDEKNITQQNFDSVLNRLEADIKNTTQNFPDYALEELYLKSRNSKPMKFSFQFFQNFALPEPLINFIFKNAYHKNLFKLYLSCKVFYYSMKIPICYYLKIGDIKATVSFQHSLFLSTSDKDLSNIKQLYLANSLCVKENDPFIISKLIPKIYKCDIQYFNGHAQILTLDEFKFLCGGVKSARISHVTDGERILSVAETIDFMPLVKSLNLKKVPLFPSTNYNIKKTRAVKIKQLCIGCVYDLDEPKKAYDFFIDVAAPKSFFSLKIFDNNQLKETLTNLLANFSWIPVEDKPFFSF